MAKHAYRTSARTVHHGFTDAFPVSTPALTVETINMLDAIEPENQGAAATALPCEGIAATTALAALLTSTIASVRDTVERTQGVLRRGARQDIHTRVPTDTPILRHGGAPLPPLRDAISRRREALGDFDGGRDHG